MGKTIRYLIATAHLLFIPTVNGNVIREWWVDASFDIHDDMKRRTSIAMTLDKGPIVAESIKQKINASSFTEAELIGVADAISKIFWCHHFMEVQGSIVEDVYVYQDNQSAILLEQNGLKSIEKETRHIKIKYFFVIDKIKNKELKVIYCSTEEILADF